MPSAGMRFSRRVEAMRITSVTPPSPAPVVSYTWDNNGRMKDLEAASLEDVQNWYAGYNGPKNSVHSLAADITP